MTDAILEDLEAPQPAATPEVEQALPDTPNLARSLRSSVPAQAVIPSDRQTGGRAKIVEFMTIEAVFAYRLVDRHLERRQSW